MIIVTQLPAEELESESRNAVNAFMEKPPSEVKNYYTTKIWFIQ